MRHTSALIGLLMLGRMAAARHIDFCFMLLPAADLPYANLPSPFGRRHCHKHYRRHALAHAFDALMHATLAAIRYFA